MLIDLEIGVLLHHRVEYLFAEGVEQNVILRDSSAEYVHRSKAHHGLVPCNHLFKFGMLLADRREDLTNRLCLFRVNTLVIVGESLMPLCGE